MSKSLTLVLRHKAQDLDLFVRPDGFVPVDAVMRCDLLSKFTIKELQAVVRDSDKQRFTLADVEGVMHIRANQGHSMKVVMDELLLERLELGSSNLPAQVVHGTYTKHWEHIKWQGLLAGGKLGQKFRNHVHFAQGLPRDGCISGMRESSEVAIYLNLNLALERGLLIYRSANGVILTPGFDGVVPTELFERVVQLKDGQELWPCR